MGDFLMSGMLPKKRSVVIEMPFTLREDLDYTIVATHDTDQDKIVKVKKDGKTVVKIFPDGRIEHHIESRNGG